MQSVHEKRRTVGTRKPLLIHNNASPKEAQVTVSFLGEHNVHILTHTLNILNYVPLFPVLTQRMAGRMFHESSTFQKPWF